MTTIWRIQENCKRPI